jgi:hypothetical protein
VTAVAETSATVAGLSPATGRFAGVPTLGRVINLPGHSARSACCAARREGSSALGHHPLCCSPHLNTACTLTPLVRRTAERVEVGLPVAARACIVLGTLAAG